MIPTYRKLLVTTDLSPLGNAAIPHAYAVLAERGGTVVLCHAVEVPGLPNPLYARYSRGRVLSGNEREEFREALLRELEQLVPEEVRTRPVVARDGSPEGRAAAATLAIRRGCSWRGSRGGFRGPSHRGIVLRGIVQAIANPTQRTLA